MYLKEIILLLEKKLSPKLFKLNSEVYGIQYGNSNPKKIIKKVMITLDLSIEAIHFAIKKKVNLIISYRGLIDKPIKNFNQNLVNKLSLLSKYPISIFVLNSSFIAAEEGISDTIMEALYFDLDRTFDIKNRIGERIPIGRICLPKDYPNQKQPLKLEGLMKRIKTTLCVKRISYVGDLNKIIKKICIVGGDNSNMESLERALKYGCDCYISCNINYKDAVFARDVQLCLITLCYYGSEIISLKKFCNVLSLEFPYEEIFLFESKDPFNTY